jgi:large exoprotein involved in heme utilization and adhesion
MAIVLKQSLVNQDCYVLKTPQRGKFAVTGRGGLPPTPEETVSSDTMVLEDWGDIVASINQPPISPQSQQTEATTTPLPPPLLQPS